MSERPWFKFFPGDWRSDSALRMCSPTARCLWMEMLCLMADAVPRGHLLIKGHQISDDALAVQAGLKARDVRASLAELETNGVFSRTSAGVIFSRKMVRDWRKSEEQRARVEKRWSVEKTEEIDPGITSGTTERDTGSIPIFQKPELDKNDDDETRARDLSDWNGERLSDLEQRLRLAAGTALNVASPKLLVLAPIVGLLSPGAGPPCDLELDVLPAIRATAPGAQSGSIMNWSYFAKPIAEARDRRLAGAPKVVPFDRATGPPANAASAMREEGRRRALARFEDQA